MDRIRGFTLLELMITLVIAAVILGLAVPSFQNTISRNAVKATTRDLVSTLNTARMQSMSSRAPVTVKPAAGGWADGWELVYSSSVEPDRTFEPSRKAKVISAANSLLFRAEGGLTGAANTLFVCHADSSIPGRKITVSFLGKVTTAIDSSKC